MNGKGDKNNRVKDWRKYREEYQKIFKRKVIKILYIKPATNPPIAPLKNNKTNT